MKRLLQLICLASLILPTSRVAGEPVVRKEITSPYHHIIVFDEDGYRTLSFDGTTETRMSLENPLEGHFEYTEYFHLAWLWNTQLSRVLMIGLGGASVQRSFEHYYPAVQIETVEIDPSVRSIAGELFGFEETDTQRVHLQDGRVFLRRSRARFDVIIADAYTRNRYGSSIPYHLATREFFELADDHLTTNGVMAYNVIGTLDGWQREIVGSVYRTMKTVFPHVYLLPARSSRNIVLVATKTDPPLSLKELRQRADALVESGTVTLPTFEARFRSLRTRPPDRFLRARVLTDDYAPVDGLLTGRR